MISVETTASFLAQLGQETKSDPAAVVRLVAEYVSSEPNFCAFISVLNGSLGMKDPTTLAFMALSLYQKMRQSQDASDNLKKSIGDEHRP